MTYTNEQILTRMNSFLPATGLMMGMKLVQLDQEVGFVRVEYLAKPEFCNPMGSVQGGFVAAMLDDAAAYAVIAKAQSMPEFSGTRIGVPTLEFKTSFLAAAHAGQLVAEARCLKFGRNIAFAESKLFNTDGKLLAVMSTTVMPKLLTTPVTLVERPAA